MFAAGGGPMLIASRGPPTTPFFGVGRASAPEKPTARNHQAEPSHAHPWLPQWGGPPPPAPRTLHRDWPNASPKFDLYPFLPFHLFSFSFSAFLIFRSFPDAGPGT
jgi:hypothetical protein